jgi:hypothetical protein
MEMQSFEPGFPHLTAENVPQDNVVH